jgi:transcriptional regulator with XRE-family HTH domain
MEETMLPVVREILMSDGFGPWLRDARKRRGWTLERLAEAAETTHASISRLESNRANASRKMVEALAGALAPDDATDGEIEALTANALLAAGFVPPGGMPEVEREIDADTIFEYLEGYDGPDQRLIAAKGVARQIDEILKSGKIVTTETPENELSGQE